jgi:hypothetical protein
MPSLVLPFALVGLAATLFTLSAVAAVRVGAQGASLGWAGGTGAFAGAVVGVLLRRWRSLHNPMFRDQATVRVGIVVVVAGALVGTVLGIEAWGTDGILPFALGGALLSLGFVPACTTVLGAGRSAARARLGSVVAGADRRTIWGTTFSAVAVTTLAGLPAIAGGCVRRVSAPQQASLVLSVAIACVLGGALLAILDKRGMAALRRLALTRPLEEAGEHAAASRACVDVGLGDSSWTAAGGAATYRSADQREVLLRGDVQAALTALDEAFKRRVTTQGLAALAIASTLATCLAVDVRPVGAQGCFRRVRAIEDIGCECVDKPVFVASRGKLPH